MITDRRCLHTYMLMTVPSRTVTGTRVATTPFPGDEWGSREIRWMITSLSFIIRLRIRMKRFLSSSFPLRMMVPNPNTLSQHNFHVHIHSKRIQIDKHRHVAIVRRNVKDEASKESSTNNTES